MIRELIAADIQDVLVLRKSTVENIVTQEDFDAWGVSTDSLARALNDNVKGWVYEVEGKIVGYVMAASDSAQVLVLAVHPQFEGKGVGGGLLGVAESWLCSNGHSRLWLKTSTNKSFRAYGFYLHHGWRSTGEIEGKDEIFEKYYED